jgi:hypothetical protein
MMFLTEAKHITLKVLAGKIFGEETSEKIKCSFRGGARMKCKNVACLLLFLLNVVIAGKQMTCRIELFGHSNHNTCAYCLLCSSDAQPSQSALEEKSQVTHLPWDRISLGSFQNLLNILKYQGEHNHSHIWQKIKAIEKTYTLSKTTELVRE